MAQSSGGWRTASTASRRHWRFIGERVCLTPEAFKAWSQNLGHEHVLTTFTSYGAISSHRQAEIFEELRSAKGNGAPADGEPDPATVDLVLDHLKRKATRR